MAAITNYATLLTAVDDYLSRTDLGASGGGWSANFVQNMEGKLYRSVRFVGNEAALSGTIANGVIAVPSDYVALKHAEVVVSGQSLSLERIGIEEIYGRFPVRSGSNIPKYIARDQSSFIFGPFPAAGYTISGTYYKRLTALSSSSTNWFTDNAPELLLYGALAEAFYFIRDMDEFQKWNMLFTESVNTVNNMERIERGSGSSLATRVA